MKTNKIIKGRYGVLTIGYLGEWGQRSIISNYNLLLLCCLHLCFQRCIILKVKVWPLLVILGQRHVNLSFLIVSIKYSLLEEFLDFFLAFTRRLPAFCPCWCILTSSYRNYRLHECSSPPILEHPNKFTFFEAYRIRIPQLIGTQPNERCIFFLNTGLQFMTFRSEILITIAISITQLHSYDFHVVIVKYVEDSSLLLFKVFNETRELNDDILFQDESTARNRLKGCEVNLVNLLLTQKLH